MLVTTDDASRFLFALPYGSDFKSSGTRKLHIRQLNDVLHLSIQRGDLIRARRAWTILLHCKEYNWKVMWKTGLLLASGTGNANEGGKEDVQFLKKAMRQQPEQQEAILQELVLQLTAHDRFREAMDELQLYLPSFPFQDNPILHLYAGLICFHLANNSENEGSTESLLVQAKGHLDRSLALNSDNTTANAFIEEVRTNLANTDIHNQHVTQITLSLSRARNGSLQNMPEPPSEDDMDLDANSEGTPAKRTRLANTTT